MGERSAAKADQLILNCRQLDATQTAQRDVEARADHLETENVALGARVRDLQQVLQSLSEAMSASVRVLTAPDTSAAQALSVTSCRRRSSWLGKVVCCRSSGSGRRGVCRTSW